MDTQVDVFDSETMQMSVIEQQEIYELSMTLLVDQSTWWDRLWDKDALENTEVLPIYKISTSDLDKDSELFSTSLYVNEEDSDKIKNKATKAMSGDETPYLLRFAVTDLYTEELWYDDTLMPKPGSIVGELMMEHVGFLQQQTVFLDFKIIHLTFETDGVYKTIPVVQDPVDILGNFVTPAEKDTGLFSPIEKWWDEFTGSNDKDDNEEHPWYHTLFAWLILVAAVGLGGFLIWGEIKLSTAVFGKGGVVFTVLGVILIIACVVVDVFLAVQVIKWITSLGGLW